MKRHVTEEDIQMAIKYTKIYSTSLAIWEVQINTTMRHCYIPFIKSKIKKKMVITPNAGKDSEKLGHS